MYVINLNTIGTPSLRCIGDLDNIDTCAVVMITKELGQQGTKHGDSFQSAVNIREQWNNLQI